MINLLLFFISIQSLVVVFFAFNLLKVIFVGAASVFAALTMINIAREEHWDRASSASFYDEWVFAEIMAFWIAFPITYCGLHLYCLNEAWLYRSFLARKHVLVNLD